MSYWVPKAKKTAYELTRKQALARLLYHPDDTTSGWPQIPGMSKSEVARLLGVSRWTIRRWMMACEGIPIREIAERFIRGDQICDALRLARRCGDLSSEDYKGSGIEMIQRAIREGRDYTQLLR